MFINCINSAGLCQEIVKLEQPKVNETRSLGNMSCFTLFFVMIHFWSYDMFSPALMDYKALSPTHPILLADAARVLEVPSPGQAQGASLEVSVGEHVGQAELVIVLL